MSGEVKCPRSSLNPMEAVRVEPSICWRLSTVAKPVLASCRLRARDEVVGFRPTADDLATRPNCSRANTCQRMTEVLGKRNRSVGIAMVIAQYDRHVVGAGCVLECSARRPVRFQVVIIDHPKWRHTTPQLMVIKDRRIVSRPLRHSATRVWESVADQSIRRVRIPVRPLLRSPHLRRWPRR